MSDKLRVELIEMSSKLVRKHLLEFVDTLGDSTLTERLLRNTDEFEQIIDEVKHKLDQRPKTPPSQ